MKYSKFTYLIKEVIDNRGKTVPTVENGFPLIATNCIKLESIYPTFENIRYVSKEILNSWFRAHIQPGDILLVNKGTPGRTCLVPDPVTFCVAQDMVAVRADEKEINYKYLFAALRSDFVQKQISNFHVGLVIPHFKKGDFDKLQIPRLVERSIEDFVGDFYFQLSNKIELNNKINSELESFAKTIYDYWFVQYDFPDENDKPYKSSGGNMVWSEELKRSLPKDWRIGKIRDLTNIFDTIRIPVSNRERLLRQGIYPYYGATQVMDYIDDYLFDGEYILLAEDGSVMDSEGYPVLQYVSGKFWVNNHAHVLQAKDINNNNFLFMMLKYIPVVQMMTGSVQKKVNQENLLETKIIIPSDKILSKFSKIIIPIRNKLIENLEENKELIKLRDWLLPMLMNGQVTIK